ncbi:hypothetical protein N4T20_15640 [Flavobacterium sp. TR2]|uniref:hypothetical protein n=1 Tax=Flavobacterium sp. TR2 TaxID=2977321 RepID=UPI0021B12255|nr:hypothetical protein [Flavobacterium sp. TR2]UWY27155.1 hypothetical protein N4T20_15640 [Flavobacterium sp. TR2]
MKFIELTTESGKTYFININSIDCIYGTAGKGSTTLKFAGETITFNVELTELSKKLKGEEK